MNRSVLGLLTGLLGLSMWLCLSWAGDKTPSQEVPANELTEIHVENTQPIPQGGIVRLKGWVTPKAVESSSTGWTVKLLGQSAKLYPLSTPPMGEVQALLGISAEAPVGTTHIQVVSPQGQVVQTLPLTIADGRFKKQNISVSKQTAGLQPIPGELEAINRLKTTLSETRYWQLPLISPTPDCENSPFGVKRYHNGVYIHDYHKGVDLRSPHGRPIKAIAGGKVVIGTSQFRLHGGTVGLDHGQGLTSIYIHLSKILVKPGQIVQKGDPIGLVGSTGFASGPHLHWGLYANGVPVNPDAWIPVRRCGG